jgi:hypothetical protein
VAHLCTVLQNLPRVETSVLIYIIILLLLVCSIILVLRAKSPFIISLGLVILSFTLRLAVHSAGYLWVTYTLVIMFLGGIIIVFIYASSIDSVFKLMIKIQKGVRISISLVALSLVSWTYFLNLSHFYSTPVWLNFCSSRAGVLCVIILLILSTLFIVVKLVQIREGPLKF